jgi:hypothetical protein
MKHVKVLALSALLVSGAIALGACRGGNKSTDSAYGGTTTGAATSMGASTGAMPMDSMHRDTTRRDTSMRAPGTKRP